MAQPGRKRRPQPRALSDAERQIVLATLNSETYRDQPPGEVYHRLLEQGEYLCSVSTLYRLLREGQASGERRAQRPAQHHAVPRLRELRSLLVYGELKKGGVSC